MTKTAQSPSYAQNTDRVTSHWVTKACHKQIFLRVTTVTMAAAVVSSGVRRLLNHHQYRPVVLQRRCLCRHNVELADRCHLNIVTS